MSAPYRSAALSSKHKPGFTRAPIENILGISFYEKTHIEILESGKDLLPAITESLLSATKFICLEFYIFKDDETGNMLAEILKKRAMEGVRVYVLYDHFGSFFTSGRFWSGMKKAGIKFRSAHPFKISSPRSYLYRNHKKLIIIDGEKAFTGGFNIADEYYGLLRKKQPAWHDIGICLKGPIVNYLSDRFTKNWHRWRGSRIHIDSCAESLDGRLPVIPVFADTGRERRRMRRLFIHSIKSARKNIYISTPYFIPRRRVLKAVLSAAINGVEVKLLLPGKSDIKSVNYATRSYYRRLLNAGVTIYNFQEAVLHAKTALFDDSWAIIGSTNLDYQSLIRNDESNVGILDRDFGLRMKEVFNSALEKSIKIDKERWPGRPFYNKVLEKIFSLLFKL